MADPTTVLMGFATPLTPTDNHPPVRFRHGPPAVVAPSLVEEPAAPSNADFVGYNTAAETPDPGGPLATFDKLETDTKRKIDPESLARLISIGKALERGDTAYLGKVRDGILQSAKVVLEHRRGSTPRPGYRNRAKPIKVRK